MQPLTHLSPARFVLAAGRVVPCDDGEAGGRGPLGAIDDGAVLVEGGRVRAVGPRAAVLARAAGAPLLDDAPFGLLTPGLVDAHTHAAWVGSRHGEYAVRLSGGDYEAIARAGGGIRASMRALRAASGEQVLEALAARLSRMARMGVTTVEVKSGYGLDEATERKQLEAIAEAARGSGPRVVATYLALHALPPEWQDRRAEYIGAVGRSWLPAIAAAGLAAYVDAYVDRAAFTVAEAREVLTRARALGLGVRLHAGQFADVGGAELAAELGAASADHLEHVSQAGLAALASSGTLAVLLPVASFTLGQAPPPLDAMRRAGVSMVVASDANPGTAPTESLPLALAFAARTYGLSAEEALLAATQSAARSLGLGGETGSLRPGYAADLVLWDLPHEQSLIQPWGAPPLRRVVARGVELRR